MRVLAAMSGGVDSAVAAARAIDAGHEVVGVHLALSRMPGTVRAGSRGCCTIEDSMDAARAANHLGIPYFVWDFSERFRSDVVEDFVSEYAQGRTPNPCMRCNERIKFAALLERALALGFDALCTGHYAAVRIGAGGQRELHRASAEAKDQSYVLGVLTAEQLAHAYFPLGETPSKALVREEAARRGLSVAAKPDSHDICFIPDGDTKAWLHDRLDAEPGVIRDVSGTVVGAHDGTFAYTVGQRRGLHLGVPAADGRPRFVLQVRPKEREIIVGPKESLAVSELSGKRFSWAGQAPDLAEVARGVQVDVQIRAHADPVPATLSVRDLPCADGDESKSTDQAMELVITPQNPLDGVAPGQTAVIYLGTRVLGQFTIDHTVNQAPIAVS